MHSLNFNHDLRVVVIKKIDVADKKLGGFCVQVPTSLHIFFKNVTN